MNIIKKITSTKHGRIFLSIIWGLGISALFRKACTHKNCIVIKGPNTIDVKNKIYEYQQKCYKFNPKISKC